MKLRKCKGNDLIFESNALNMGKKLRYKLMLEIPNLTELNICEFELKFLFLRIKEKGSPFIRSEIWTKVIKKRDNIIASNCISFYFGSTICLKDCTSQVSPGMAETGLMTTRKLLGGCITSISIESNLHVSPTPSPAYV